MGNDDFKHKRKITKSPQGFQPERALTDELILLLVCKESKWRSEDLKALLKVRGRTTTRAPGSSWSVCFLCTRTSVGQESDSPPRRKLGFAFKVVFCWHTGHLGRKVTSLHCVCGAGGDRLFPSVPARGLVQPRLWKRHQEVNTRALNFWNICCHRAFLEVCPARENKSEKEAGHKRIRV